MNIGNRIKRLRNVKSLTQQEFANKLGVSRSNIATYEVGKNNPGDAVINLICREFFVNETWLRTGEGEMFVELPENEALAAQIQTFLQGGTDSFRERLVSLLLRLPPEHWEVLERYALELVDGSKVPATPVPETDTRSREEKPVTEWTEEDIDAEVEDYRRQLLEEKEQTGSGPASGGSSGEPA